VNCLSDDFDLPYYNIMANFKNREMFKNRNNIDHLLEVRGTTLKAKRKIIITANTPLFYIFGYDLTDKPWLSYAERYL
jgi:hypothetical protein